jgi:hypothetical protein
MDVLNWELPFGLLFDYKIAYSTIANIYRATIEPKIFVCQAYVSLRIQERMSTAKEYSIFYIPSMHSSHHISKKKGSRESLEKTPKHTTLS